MLHTKHSKAMADERNIESALIRKAEAIAHNTTKDTAVIIPLENSRGDMTGSNGNLFVAIIRRGRLVTEFYRRDNQPVNERKLRVDQILRG